MASLLLVGQFLKGDRTMEPIDKDCRQRENIAPGDIVGIVQKKDQRSGRITEGRVKEILTRSHTHPHGIKVRLSDGLVGRVRYVYTKA